MSTFTIFCIVALVAMVLMLFVTVLRSGLALVLLFETITVALVAAQAKSNFDLPLAICAGCLVGNLLAIAIFAVIKGEQRDIR